MVSHTIAKEYPSHVLVGRLFLTLDLMKIMVQVNNAILVVTGEGYGAMHMVTGRVGVG